MIVGWNYGCFLWSGGDDWESSISLFKGSEKGGERLKWGKGLFFPQIFNNIYIERDFSFFPLTVDFFLILIKGE